MFDTLTEKFDAVFKQLRGRGRLTEENIQQALREVRLALLEADVNFKVVKDFVAAVRERAVGHDVLQSLTPAQQVVKVVRDELGLLMGGNEDNRLDLAARPPVPITPMRIRSLAPSTGNRERAVVAVAAAMVLVNWRKKRSMGRRLLPSR